MAPTCSEKYNYAEYPIKAKYVDWTQTSNPAQFDSHDGNAQRIIARYNDGHSGYLDKPGKLKDAYFDDYGESKCDEKELVLIFKVSKDGSGQALIQDENYVVRPCPPFCGGGINDISKTKEI